MYECKHAIQNLFQLWLKVGFLCNSRLIRRFLHSLRWSEKPKNPISPQGGNGISHQNSSHISMPSANANSYNRQKGQKHHFVWALGKYCLQATTLSDANIEKALPCRYKIMPLSSILLSQGRDFSFGKQWAVSMPLALLVVNLLLTYLQRKYL